MIVKDQVTVYVVLVDRPAAPDNEGNVLARHIALANIEVTIPPEILDAAKALWKVNSHVEIRLNTRAATKIVNKQDILNEE